MATSSKRRRAVVLGSLILAVGLVGAVVLWVAGGSRRSDAIENFARAPIGCDTTLDFAESGTYLLFVETAGRLDEVRGDCDAPAEYDVTTDQPAVEVTMIDPDGDELELDDASGAVSYSRNGFVGRAAFRVDVAEAADHVIRVETPEQASFAVAVGRDPDNGVALLRGIGVAVGVIGLAAGLAMILAGGREKRQAPVGAWAPAQPSQPQWGTTAPTQPPYRQPPSLPTQPPIGSPAMPPRSDQPSPPVPQAAPGDTGSRPPMPPSVPPPPRATGAGSQPSNHPQPFAPPTAPSRVDDGTEPPTSSPPRSDADIWDETRE